MRYTIGLDIGTTNVKGVLRSESGELAAKASVRFEYDSPEANFVEIDADRFVANCMEVIGSLVEQVPGNGEITALSEVSASGNLLLLDSQFKPLTPIINWQDGRVTDEVDRVLGADFDYDAYYRKIGWPLGTAFPLAQLCYLKCHAPELLEKAAAVCMSTEYLNFILTGKFGITASAGTPFFLIDQTSRRYDSDMLARLGIHESQLPPIMKIGEILGEIESKICDLHKFPRGIQVKLGTFDHPGCARSMGVTEEGRVMLSCGTSWVAFMPIESRDAIIKNHFLCDPFLSEEGGCWAAMCSVASIDGVVNRLVKRYISDGDDRFTVLDSLAEASRNGSGGLVIEPNKLDETMISTYPKENIAYAILEMPVRLLRQNLDVFLNNGVKLDRLYMAGGPAKSAIWVKITERIIGFSVEITNAEFSGAVGAAMIAGKD